MAYLSCSFDVFFLYLGQSPLSMSIIFNIKKAQSLLQPSLSSVNGKWQLLQVNSCPVYVTNQVSVVSHGEK